MNYYASAAAGGVEGGEETCQRVLFLSHTELAYNCWCKYKEATVGALEEAAGLVLSADLVL